ncbi:MAG: hypothetical protein K8S23_11340 [Candidatus Cloacimonetes bacterium]|nr:hypothetical protein [Candidatus Cloacimonadota bacterium]
MDAIRKITTVTNGIISFDDLNRFNCQEVEVIILPLLNRVLNKLKFQRENILKYDGILDSDYKDTSSKIDELIYGK